MSKINWIQTGSTYTRMEGDIVSTETLPVGIYEVGLSMNGWFLTKVADKFVFNYKIYDLQNGFINHVKKTYNSTKGNLGILFNGTRGTGKSVTAKILANELNLPVIIIKSMEDNNQALISYLSSFNFDCIFFFDEFEKQFSDEDCSILQIMDGVYNSEFRKIFLLTTNELNINKNLLSRPSRIRYVREFGNLDLSVIKEYLDDNLIDKNSIEDLIEYISTLEISTIDILKAIVEEANIHGVEEFLSTKKFFNVRTAHYSYSCIKGSINVSEVYERHYTIEDFVKNVIAYKNKPKLMEKLHQDLHNAKSDEEKREIQEKFDQEFYSPCYMEYTSVCSDKPWDKLKPNKDFLEDDDIIFVDTEHSVICTQYNNFMYFWYILNPKSTPSLYGNTGFSGMNLFNII